MHMRIFDEITEKLAYAKKVPSNLLTMGWWLALNISEETLEILSALEDEVGETEANRRLCAACEASGRYKWDRSDDTIERL